MRLREDRPRQHVEVKCLYTCPVPERLERIVDGLDAIFKELIPPAETFKAIEISDRGFRADPSVRFEAPRQAGLPRRIGWELNWSPNLPESYWEDDTPETSGERLAILLYEVRYETEPGAYEAIPKNEDFFAWVAETPCRKFSFSVIPDPGNNRSLRFNLNDVEATVRDRTVRMEKERIKSMMREGSSTLVVEHPLPGISYKFLWKVA